MKRIVEIRNLSNKEIVLGDGDDQRKIAPLGKYMMPYAEYIDKAINTDMESLDIRVSVPLFEVQRASVKDFGAKGDGIRDDTRAIQAAIDQIAGYGGGVVDIPIGIYLVSGILVEGNVFLQGESKYDSVLKLKVGSKNAILSFADSTAGISKLRLVGNG